MGFSLGIISLEMTFRGTKQNYPFPEGGGLAELCARGGFRRGEPVFIKNKRTREFSFSGHLLKLCLEEVERISPQSDGAGLVASVCWRTLLRHCPPPPKKKTNKNKDQNHRAS